MTSPPREKLQENVKRKKNQENNPCTYLSSALLNAKTAFRRQNQKDRDSRVDCLLETGVSISRQEKGSRRQVCVFITAGPITKLFAGGGGGEWRTCAMRDDEPRPVWMSPLITH